MQKHKKKSQKTLGKRIGKICAIVGIVILVLILVVVIVGFILYKQGKSSLYKNADTRIPTGLQSAEQDMLVAQEKAKLATIQWQDDWIAYEGKIYEYNEEILNLLFLGIDQHGLLEKETDYSDWESGQADAIFVLSLNPATKTMKIVAVPRNSMVTLNIYGSDGQIEEQIRNQICLQYGYAGGGKSGLEEMKRAVSELLYNLPIHAVTAIGYDAIPIMNDMVGGVEVVVLEDITQYDPLMVEGETVHLLGEHAYLYIQYRDVTSAGSPTARLQRQKQYLLAFIQEAKNRFKESPLIVTEMYESLSEYMWTDITLDEAIYLAAEVLDYKIELDSIYLLEGEDYITTYINEDGEEDFFDDYYLNEESIKKTLIDVFYSEVRFE